MAKFIINKGYQSEISVEAASFSVSDGWAVLYDGNHNTVYATHAGEVHTIEKEGAVSRGTSAK